MNEQQIKQELIDFCERRIKEAGLTNGYYHEILKVLHENKA